MSEEEKKESVIKIGPHPFQYSDDFIVKLDELFPPEMEFGVLLAISPQVVGISIKSALDETKADLLKPEKILEHLATPEGVKKLQRAMQWCVDVEELHIQWIKEVCRPGA